MRLDRLAYIKFGPASGGVLLDLSEGGLRCQIVGPVIEGEICRVQFALPRTSMEIEADVQVVWSNKSRQGGGVRFLKMNAADRAELQKWVARERATFAPVTILHAPADAAAVEEQATKSRSEAVTAINKQKLPGAKRIPVAQTKPLRRPAPERAADNAIALMREQPAAWRPLWLALVTAAAMLAAAALFFASGIQ